MQVDINVNFHQAEHLKIFSRKKFEEKKFVSFFFFSVIDSKLQFYDLKKSDTKIAAHTIALNYFLNPLFHVTAQRMKRCSDILVQAILHLKSVL